MSAALADADAAVGSIVSLDFHRPPTLTEFDRPFHVIDKPSNASRFIRVPGCNFGIRRAVFDAIGRFDEDLLLGQVRDLAFRLQLAGYQIANVPEARVLRRKSRRFLLQFRKGIHLGRYRALLIRRYGSAGISFPRTVRSPQHLWWLISRISLLPLSSPLRAHWAHAAGAACGEFWTLSHGAFRGDRIKARTWRTVKGASRPREQQWSGARSYWEDRFQRHGADLRGVGRIGLDEDANRLQYQIKAARLHRVLDDVRRRLQTLLDAGTGTGVFAALAADLGFTVTAVDFSETALERARKRAPAVRSWIRADLADLSGLQPHDIVMCIDVLFHVVDDGKWAASVLNLADSVRDGGILIIQEHLRGDLGELDGPKHVRWRTLRDYQDILSGWEIKAHQRYRLPYSGEHKDLLVWRRQAES